MFDDLPDSPFSQRTDPDDPQTLPIALRLIGTHDGEELTWLFVDAG